MIINYNQLIKNIDQVIVQQCINKIALNKPVPAKVKKAKKVKLNIKRLKL